MRAALLARLASAPAMPDFRIDWENALIRVCGKSRRTAVLPLPQDVGDVLRSFDVESRILNVVPSNTNLLRGSAGSKPFMRVKDSQSGFDFARMGECLYRQTTTRRPRLRVQRHGTNDSTGANLSIRSPGREPKSWPQGTAKNAAQPRSHKRFAIPKAQWAELVEITQPIFLPSSLNWHGNSDPSRTGRARDAPS